MISCYMNYGIIIILDIQVNQLTGVGSIVFVW